MEENTNADIFAQLFWAATGETPLSLMFLGFDLILSIATLVFVAIGTISLLKSARPGSLYIAFGLAGLIVAVLGAPALVSFADEDGIIEDILGLYMSACVAVSAYGFWRLSRFLKHERAGEGARA
jgi:hypothetical protein